MRLGFAVDDFEIETECAVNHFHEFAGIRRGPTGFGCNQPGARDMAAAHFVVANRERVERALDRRFREAAC